MCCEEESLRRSDLQAAPRNPKAPTAQAQQAKPVQAPRKPQMQQIVLQQQQQQLQHQQHQLHQQWLGQLFSLPLMAVLSRCIAAPRLKLPVSSNTKAVAAAIAASTAAASAAAAGASLSLLQRLHLPGIEVMPLLSAC